MNNKNINAIEREYLKAVSYESLGMADVEKKKTKMHSMKILRCKHCQSQSFEILTGKSYGKSKAWQERDHVRNFFRFHCLKCGVTYDFKPEKPSLALKMAVNKKPILSDNYKKRFLLQEAIMLKALRNKSVISEDRKQDIRDIEQYLGQYLEVDEPMVLGNWLIVKDRNDQVRVYDNKDNYYRAESFYQNVIKPGKCLR